GCKVRIPSALVSRLHCRLLGYQGFLLAEDLHSVNGTYLNGKAVHGFEPVRPGDKLEVGPVEFAVDYELSPAAHQRLGKFDGEVVGVKPVPPFGPRRRGRPAQDGADLEVVELDDLEEVEELEGVEEAGELEVVEEYTDDDDIPEASLVEE